MIFHPTTRRQLLGLLGAGLSAGCVTGGSDDGANNSPDSPNHVVRIGNARETSHEAFVELEWNGESSEYGPETVEPDESWEVTRIETEGTLTVRFSVDDELVWTDTHEVPTPTEGDQSRVVVDLLPDGDVFTAVEWDE